MGTTAHTDGAARKAEGAVPIQWTEFGHLLREARHDAAVTIARLSGQIGVHRNTLSRMFRGELLPNRPQLVLLASALGQDMADLEPAWRRAREAKWRPASEPTATVEGRESIAITYLHSTDEFYSSLSRRLATAKRHVKTTYIRQFAPDHYQSQEARSYFETSLAWSDTGGMLSRVVGIPDEAGRPDPKFISWLRRHVAEAETHRNYDFRVVPWSTPSDAINLALIDDETTFLTFSQMHSQHRVGLQAEGPRFLEGFNAYWEQLWSGGKVPQRYLHAFE